MHHTKSYIFSKPNKKIHGAYVVSDRKITVDSGFRLYHRGYAVPKISGAPITIIVIRYLRCGLSKGANDVVIHCSPGQKAFLHQRGSDRQ